MPLIGSSNPDASEAEGTKWAAIFGGVAFPPLPYQLGARVEHFIAPRKGILSELVASELDMPMWFAQSLVKFGAVYSCSVPPPLRPEVVGIMGADKLSQAEQARESAMQLSGRDPALSVPRRAQGDIEIEHYSYVRVHCVPKRFPAVYSCDWKERIVHIGADYVVVNKPPGVPTAPTVDNLLESCPACAGSALGHDGPLLITSRLDHCTEGLVVLAKTSAFAALYNHLQSAKVESGEACIRKYYRALSHRPPPLGAMVHYLKMNQRVIGKSERTAVHPDSSKGGKHSELEVLEVQSVRLTGKAADEWGSQAYESLIELKTGRTHQIRAQYAASGAPICGDTLYGSSNIESHEGHLPQDCLTSTLDKGYVVLEEKNAVGAEPLIAEGFWAPTAAIGLQCAKLVLCNLHRSAEWRTAHIHTPVWSTFEAGSPWWRKN